MRPSHLNFMYSLLVGIAVLGLAACGNINDSSNFQSETLGDLNTQAAQQEIHSVMSAVQTTIMAGLTEKEDVVAGNCKPKFKLKLSGVGFLFDAKDECKLQGEVSVKFFPLRAIVDLEVVGMKHVESMDFEAEIDIKGSKTVTVDWELIDGRIQLKNFKLLPMEELVLNGRTHAEIGKGTFLLDSRTNAFAGDTGFGFAVIGSFTTDVRSLEACVLTGGVGTDPMAGETKACVSILK